MLSNNVFYHGSIRKTIVAFGTLFSNIFIDRKSGGSVDGTTIQRLQIPIAYAPKEKWLVRIESDPTLQNQTYTTLPRMSFEITGYSYDSTRKTNKNNYITCGDANGVTRMFAPVPYNVSISLYVLTKTQEDGLQIVEQILPFFCPEFTMSLKMIPEANVILDVPIVLNSMNVVDEYDGDFQTRRFITHTLDFTVKTSLFGPVESGGLIRQANVDVGNLDENLLATYTANGLSDGTITDFWNEDLL